MILDNLLLLSDAQAVTAAAASTNSVDFSQIRNIGVGEDLYLVVACTTAMTDSGSDSTLAVTIETDDNSSFSSATTSATVGTFAALSAAGTQLVYRIPAGVMNERYMQLRYTPSGGNLTTGSFDAFITHDVQQYTSYADNITIS